MLEDARLIRREVDRCQTILSRMRVDIGDEGSTCTAKSRSPILRAELRESINEHELSRLRIMPLMVRSTRVNQFAIGNRLSKPLLVLLQKCV